MHFKTPLRALTKHIGLLFLMAFAFSGFSQNNTGEAALETAFDAYTQLPREIGYTHLNKTIYSKGETIGFTVYVFDKSTKKPSLATTNVYFEVTDQNNNPIKKELILALNGVASGSIAIDSTFTSGEYVFRAYTNWMRNFDELNHASQAFRVFDLQKEQPEIDNSNISAIDAQFLPEGGHLVADVQNSVGVIIKDGLGFGVPNSKGILVDTDNNLIIDFQTNEFGIGKFSFLPESNKSYKVLLDTEHGQQSFPLEQAKTSGIALTLNDLNDKVALSFRVNESTLKQIQDEVFSLTIHNGSILKISEFSFGNDDEVLKIISYEDLSPGINIFTLFDSNGKPLLERLFFNYEGIEFLTTGNPQFEESMDSIRVRIPVTNIDPEAFSNFSVSILPEGTKSYSPNNNIISVTYLQPYIKTYVENADYYFTDISRKKKFELDNLLLTQGWSSYDWQTIFDHPPKIVYPHENGISFKADILKGKASRYMMHATLNNEMQVFELDDGDKDFGATELFPMDAEQLKFSAISKNNALRRPQLNLQFSPTSIPTLDKNESLAPIRFQSIPPSDYDPVLQTSWEHAEELEAVLIKTDKVATREDKLLGNNIGNVVVVDEIVRRSYKDLPSYLQTKGFLVYEAMGTVTILSPRKYSIENNRPVRIYLDDMLLQNTDNLYRYNLDDVDYIYYDKTGIGEGGAGASGVIKIYTNPEQTRSSFERNTSQDVSIPLTFTNDKQFYTPRYSSYHNTFYQEYGVMGWFPKLQADENGFIEFDILLPSAKQFNVFIEGTTENGQFISERKRIELP